MKRQQQPARAHQIMSGTILANSCWLLRGFLAKQPGWRDISKFAFSSILTPALKVLTFAVKGFIPVARVLFIISTIRTCGCWQRLGSKMKTPLECLFLNVHMALKCARMAPKHMHTPDAFQQTCQNGSSLSIFNKEDGVREDEDWQYEIWHHTCVQVCVHAYKLTDN